MTVSFRESPSVVAWLNRLAPSTQIVNWGFFKAFLAWKKEHGGQFRDFTPDQLVEYQKEHKDYALLDQLIQPYITAKAGRFNTKKTRYSNIKSFFKHNRAQLPDDPTFKIKPEVAPVQGTLTALEIKTTVLSCDPMHQAVYMCMFQGALDQEMVIHWSRHGLQDLKKQLAQAPRVIKITLPGRKSQRNITPYYTFVGGDSINFLKTWLIHREEYIKTGKLAPDNKEIFISKYGTGIQKRALRDYWLDHLRVLGIVPPYVSGGKEHRTGKGLHEMRDVFRSHWSLSPAKHIMGEYFMGHVIDTLEYDKSFRNEAAYQAEYFKALPFLELLSRGEPFGQVPTGEVEKLRQDLHEIKTELTTRGPDHEVAVLLREIMADKEMGPQLLTALSEILKKSKESDET